MRRGVDDGAAGRVESEGDGKRGTDGTAIGSVEEEELARPRNQEALARCAGMQQLAMGVEDVAADDGGKDESGSSSVGAKCRERHRRAGRGCVESACRVRSAESGERAGSARM